LWLWLRRKPRLQSRCRQQVVLAAQVEQQREERQEWWRAPRGSTVHNSAAAAAGQVHAREVKLNRRQQAITNYIYIYIYTYSEYHGTRM
jgi:hypothetical protein